jgi:drug/metabolite transporter (DMT)-like permease
VLVGFLTQGLPDALTFLAFGLALASIWTIAQGSATARPLEGLRNLRALYLPLLSGIFFGMFFILMHQATKESFFWPLVSGRLAGTLIMLVYARIVRGPVWPLREVLPISILSGIADIAGSVCYVLAVRNGRLDVSAVLAALYPGSTVILAWLFLKERIAPAQAIGILLALAAIVLMTI